VSWRPSRRALLQALHVGGLGAAAGGLGLWDAAEAAPETSRGTCRICTMHCGIVGTTKGGRLVRVEGDPQSNTRGFLCRHGWALRELVHSPDRVRRPLRRKGDGFVEVSWDEALSEIAARLQKVKAEFGAQALAIQTGWPFVRHPLVHLLHRFCQAFGTPNLATVASLCEASARIGKSLLAGGNLRPDLRGARTLLVWGANPSVTSPPFAHVVEAMALRGRALIVVDPLRTELAEKATLHLQPRPGTDGALALGMARVILGEGLGNETYVQEHVRDLDEYRALCEPYGSAHVEELCGVPAWQVEAAARIFARNGPGAIWDGLGIEHHENGVQTVRAVNALSALCGYVDVPGGSELLQRPGAKFWEEPLPATYRLATAEPAPPPVEVRPIGWAEHPVHHVYNRQAQAMLFARAIEEGKPYPLKALMLFGSNAFFTSPGAERLRAARDKLSLLVVVDPFLTGSGRLADFVLPACTFAEAADVKPGEEDAEVARSGLIAEQGESRPDWRILFELARALGLGSYFPWGSMKDALDAPRVPFMKDPEHQPSPEPGHAGEPPPRFGTPSGRLELSSSVLARYGHPPLPQWIPPRATPSGEFPLHLITGPRTRSYVNSQFRQIPSVRRGAPEPLAEVHPRTAASLGLRDGQRVRVVSPKGEIELAMRVTDRVRPDTVVVPGGWEGACANRLTDPEALDPISGFPAFRSLVCRLEAARSA